MDCFAEPVIRRRYAPTGWLAMTELVIPNRVAMVSSADDQDFCSQPGNGVSHV